MPDSGIVKYLVKLRFEVDGVVERADVIGAIFGQTEGLFGPEMNLSDTASRFDNSISWLAAIGNTAALIIFDEFGPSTVYARNQELTVKLRAALTSAGWDPLDLPEQNQSTIVSVPLGHAEPARLLRGLSGQGIICSARDGNLRLSVHFYNHEDDIERLVATLTSFR